MRKAHTWPRQKHLGTMVRSQLNSILYRFIKKNSPTLDSPKVTVTFYSYFLPLAALVLGARVLATAVSFSGSLCAFRTPAAALRPRAPLAATGGSVTLSSSSSFTWTRSGVFSFSPATALAVLFPENGITTATATARPLPAGARFEAAAAAAAVGVRLPRATRSAPVPSSSVSVVALVFPRRARAVVAGASGDSARSAALRDGPSSAEASAVFLDFAPTRRLVVAGAGAGAGAASTDWLRFLPPRRGAFVVSGS